MEKVILNTDIGGDIDDAICLAYLLKEPKCELIGITTVCGESEKRASVADAICRAAGKEIPIVAGLDTTLQPVPIYPTPDGAAVLTQWPHNTYEKADAPGFLYQKIKENPHEIVLIGIGNMTNIATLFLSHPDAAVLLKALYVMNGYFGQKPLPEPYFNWNSWADPLASEIVFASRVPIHRVFPLDITEKLTIKAEQAELLLKPDSDLMKAVFSFGNKWLESAKQLTLHDPLAAVSVFYPNICGFERGTVNVETKQKENMGGTSFQPLSNGNIEIARTVDRERFYRILTSALAKNGPAKHRAVPPEVVNRAKSVGPVGEAWLANLDHTVAELEQKWHINVNASLSGGSHAFVASADGKNGEKYVLKIDLPENSVEEFLRGIIALKTANGKGCVKLYAFDQQRMACLLERLGQPVETLGFPVYRQIKIICSLLQEIWTLPAPADNFPSGPECISWFKKFIGKTWEELNRPCSYKVIRRTLDFLQSREQSLNPADFVFLHGDAHGRNTLRTLSGNRFKLIDAEGIFYEKAYDLGALMREWVDDYMQDPLAKGLQRCAYLHRLTGVSKQAIWEWGYIQTVSTAFVLLKIGQEKTGNKMLYVARYWANADTDIFKV